jgi:hypothetical protein
MNNKDIEPTPFERQSPEQRLRFFNKTKRVFTVLVILIAAGAILVAIITKDKTKRLMAHHEISNGAIVTRWQSGYRGNAPSIICAYTIDGKPYIKSRALRNFGNNLEFMLHRRLPIAYETGNPDNSYLLITPTDFGYFNLPFPDSLSALNTP